MKKAAAKALAFDRNTKALRLFVVVAAGFFFLLAQTLFAAHASNGGPEHMKGHSPAGCALCLAGGVLDDPANAAPRLAPPTARVDAVKTAIPAALLTAIAVEAASPRGPPFN